MVKSRTRSLRPSANSTYLQHMAGSSSAWYGVMPPTVMHGCCSSCAAIKQCVLSKPLHVHCLFANPSHACQGGSKPPSRSALRQSQNCRSSAHWCNAVTSGRASYSFAFLFAALHGVYLDLSPMDMGFFCTSKGKGRAPYHSLLHLALIDVHAETSGVLVDAHRVC